MLNANKIIYSLRIYLELEKLGFTPISTTSNPQKPNFMCQIYEKTPELMEALDQLL